jgi:hypothetical protein
MNDGNNKYLSFTHNKYNRLQVSSWTQDETFMKKLHNMSHLLEQL